MVAYDGTLRFLCSTYCSIISLCQRHPIVIVCIYNDTYILLYNISHSNDSCRVIFANNLKGNVFNGLTKQTYFVNGLKGASRQDLQ